MIQDDPLIIDPILKELKASFLSQKTKPLQFRKQQLKNLLKGLQELNGKFESALAQDLGYNQFNTLVFSQSISISDIENILHNIDEWAKPRYAETSLLVGPARSYVLPEPYGVALVLSAWNYPIYTALSPIAAVIAAGNCAVLKPSELAPNSSNVLHELFTKYLDNSCYRVIEGKIEVAKSIIEKPFDLIFFTGSPEKGKLVAQAAAKTLTPVILELGGKNPCIVDQSADLDNAAMRLAQGKIMNCGQTCVAPDYVFVHSAIKGKFIAKLKEKIVEFYSLAPEKNPEYTKIITEFHAQRLENMIKEEHGGAIIFGGKCDSDQRFICPTLIENPKLNSKLMKEEIFGPILPIFEYKNIDDVIKFINENPKPLSLYFFGSPFSVARKSIEEQTSSGAFSINDACFHILNHDIPFGGVQNSGIGSYHGKFGFDNCSHLKAVFNKATINFFPFSARFPPYTAQKKKIMQILLKYGDISQYKVLKKIIQIVVIFTILGLHKKGKFDKFLNAVAMAFSIYWGNKAK